MQIVCVTNCCDTTQSSVLEELKLDVSYKKLETSVVHLIEKCK